MADINTFEIPEAHADESLRVGIEMLFYAYREFTAEPDAILDHIGFGRAHHRAIYFVGRNPGITVTDLLGILRITKQSLSRVLSELVEKGYINQGTDANDRRRRPLTLTPKGVEIEHRLTETQRARVARAYAQAGEEAVEGFRRVLLGLMEPVDRARFTRE